MANVYPICSAPADLAITVNPDGFHVTWGGNAETYKLAYKKEADETWTTVEMNGNGTTDFGSGINLDDTVDPGLATATPNPILTDSDFGYSIAPGTHVVRIFTLSGLPVDRDYNMEINLIIQGSPGSIDLTIPANQSFVDSDPFPSTTYTGGPFVVSYGDYVPPPPNANADFTVTGLTPGLYDIRLFNICSDGSTYMVKDKVLIAVDEGTIPNLRFAADPGDDSMVNVIWDDPTIDTGLPFIFTWCEMDAAGKKISCDSEQLDPSARSYTVQNPTGQRIMMYVSQTINDNQASVSNKLFKTLCGPCGQPKSKGLSGYQLPGTHITGEVPVGAINGFNTAFFLTNNVAFQTEEVFIRGLLQTRDVHYSVSGNRIDFGAAPEPTDNISVNYSVA